MTHNEYIKMRIETLLEEMSHVNEENVTDIATYDVYRWRGVAHEYYMMTKRVSTRLHMLAREAYNKAVAIDESRDY